MLRVLQHYLSVRTGLLVLSETLILLLILGTGMTLHLWDALDHLRDNGGGGLGLSLARLGLSPEDARLRCLSSAALMTVLAQIAIGFNMLYDFRVSSSRYERAARFVESLGTALALGLFLTFASHLWGLERLLDFPGLRLSQRAQLLVVSLVTAFGVLYIWRIVYHWTLRHFDLNQRVLILGAKGPAHSLATEVLAHPDAGYQVVGLIPEPRNGDYEADEHHRRPLLCPNAEGTDATRALVLEDFKLTSEVGGNRGVAMDPSQSANGTSGLMQLVRSHRVDLVVVAFEDRRGSLPTRDLLRCRLEGVEVREREELYEHITGKLAVEAMRPSYLIFNEGFRRHPWAMLMKRIVDIVCALLILAVAWPAMLLSAILVRYDSPGPALFTQERVGRDGKPFTLFKFRSMRADAEKETGPVWSSEDDPRITHWGGFMRKTRLDELPQLFNVLGGSMSLIGPRPEREHFVNELAEQIPYYSQRHIVQPGLTGWAQINYPYGNTVQDALHKLQYDLFYIKNQSLLFDLSILFNTIKTVVLRHGT